MRRDTLAMAVSSGLFAVAQAVAQVGEEGFVALTYRFFGGNSALYFRAEEVNTPWLLKGFQNEIGGNNKDSALWHTAGDKTKGRGWVAQNDEFIAKVRNPDGWNTTCTIACGDRIVSILNGQRTVDGNSESAL